MLERAGKQWRDFKAKLTKNYLRKGKDACAKYNFITEQQWELFKEKRETEEFKVKILIYYVYSFTHRHLLFSVGQCSVSAITYTRFFIKQKKSEKAKASQKYNEHVHYLGPCGYAAKRTRWCVDDPINSLNNSESVNASNLSNERIGRSYDWIRARSKPKEDGGYYIPNEKTKEVFEKMVNYITDFLSFTSLLRDETIT